MPLMVSVSYLKLRPNLITLIAAMFLVIPHIYSWIKYGGGFEGEFDPLDSLIVGVCMMIYIVSYLIDRR